MIWSEIGRACVSLDELRELGLRQEVDGSIEQDQQVRVVELANEHAEFVTIDGRSGHQQILRRVAVTSSAVNAVG